MPFETIDPGITLLRFEASPDDRNDSDPLVDALLQRNDTVVGPSSLYAYSFSILDLDTVDYSSESLLRSLLPIAKEDSNMTPPTEV